MIKKGHASPTGRATFHLAMEGYEVLEVATSRGAKPSVKIDKPLPDIDAQINQVAEKWIGSCELYGCRIYWDAEPGQRVSG